MPLQQQALTPEQIAAARNWINTQYSNSAPDGGWQFNGDFSPSASGLSMFNQAGIFGAGQAMGYNFDDLAGILDSTGGMTGDQIEAYKQGHAILSSPGTINDKSVQFAMDQGWTTSDDYKRQQFNTDGVLGWMGGAEGGFEEGQRRVAYDGEANGPAPGRSGTGGQRGGNPYLDDLFGSISQQYTNTLQNQWLPSIRSNSIAAGGLGGARQGIAEANAIGQAGQGLAGALAQTGYNAWEGDQSRQLQRYGIDTNADLANQSQWMNYDLGSQGMDLNRMGLGLQAYGMGSNGPWSGLNNFGGLLGGAAGNNSNTTNNISGGGGWMGAIGGGLAGAQLGNNFGWWGK